jgi:hypothetical protein
MVMSKCKRLLDTDVGERVGSIGSDVMEVKSSRLNVERET